jgi:hypothetical protein
LKHVSTRAVFDYWDQLRGQRPSPARSDIDPGAIRHALGDTFMLATDFIDGIRFRLAGTRICALLGREMKGESFNTLWSNASRAQMADILAAVLDETNGAVAGVTGHTETGSETELELLLLPTSQDGRSRTCALGTLAPLVPPYWLGEKPVVELNLCSLRFVGAVQSVLGAPRFRNGTGRRRQHGFLVYTGGREFNSPDPTG